jgi:hypothetical protein
MIKLVSTLSYCRCIERYVFNVKIMGKSRTKRRNRFYVEWKATRRTQRKWPDDCNSPYFLVRLNEGDKSHFLQHYIHNLTYCNSARGNNNNSMFRHYCHCFCLRSSWEATSLAPYPLPLHCKYKLKEWIFFFSRWNKPDLKKLNTPLSLLATELFWIKCKIILYKFSCVSTKIL